jgi:hypothetical protein
MSVSRSQAVVLLVLLAHMGFTLISVMAETIQLTPEIQSLNIGVFFDCSWGQQVD